MMTDNLRAGETNEAEVDIDGGRHARRLGRRSGGRSKQSFLHMQAYGVSKWTWLASYAQPCGAHIIFPWRPIDNGSGVYDWSSVEAGIKPWAAAGKKVGLRFAGVDEILEDEGPGNTTLLATPDYVMKQVDVVTCGPTTVSGHVHQGRTADAGLLGARLS